MQIERNLLGETSLQTYCAVLNVNYLCKILTMKLLKNRLCRPTVFSAISVDFFPTYPLLYQSSQFILFSTFSSLSVYYSLLLSPYFFFLSPKQINLELIFKLTFPTYPSILNYPSILALRSGFLPHFAIELPAVNLIYRFMYHQLHNRV